MSSPYRNMEIYDRLKHRVRVNTPSAESQPQAVYAIISPIIMLDGKGEERLGKTAKMKNKCDTSGNSFAKIA